MCDAAHSKHAWTFAAVLRHACSSCSRVTNRHGHGRDDIPRERDWEKTVSRGAAARVPRPWPKRWSSDLTGE